MTMLATMKQALEALEFVNKSDDDGDFMNSECSARVEDAIKALRQAIAELESQEPVAWIDRDGYLYKKPPKDLDERHPPYTPLYIHPPQRTEQEPVIDKSAATRIATSLGWSPQRTEQEPFAWVHNFIDGGISIGKRPSDLDRHPDRWTALYKDPKPCPTCEALARTVMLDQTSHDTQPQRKKVVFPTMLRKMWSGGEVQAWLDENVNKKNT